MINIAVIGCGHWGPNHIRNFSAFSDVYVSSVCDKDIGRLKYISKSYPQIETTTDYHSILKNKKIDAIVVATPTFTHYKIVKDCLKAGKDVLCEKPLAANTQDASELVDIAKKNERTLMVGHVFIFNPGIQKLKEYIKNNTLGKIYYLHSTRTNLGPIRDDVNVIWDLASHDVSIFSYLLDSMPSLVTAKGANFLRKSLEDIAFISLSFPKNVLANIHVSWLDPRKVREIIIVGDKKMAVWNDLNVAEPVRLYDKGVIREPYYNDFGEFQLLIREGEVNIPKIEQIEPLRLQSLHFVECLKKRKRPISDGEFGLEVVKVLNSIQKSLKEDGKPVKIK